MAKQFYIDVEKFKKYGLVALEDTTMAPPGSMAVLNNCVITDRGGISPRPGTELVGTVNSGDGYVTGLYNFRKSFGSDEILIKSYNTKKEALSLNNINSDWFLLKQGYTQDADHGFITSLVNNDNQDYVVSCNRYEPYERWTGAVTTLSADITTGGTTIPVVSTLIPDIYDSKTAATSSATQFTVSDTPWVDNQWKGFAVHIPSTGKVRLITANTNNSITFDTLGADPGAVPFEIRQLAFPASGTIIYAGTTLPYTSIDTATSFIVASRHNATSGTPVTVVPEEFPGAPRGNRFTNLLARLVLGRVRSALTRNSSGNEIGYSTAGSYFVSKINNATEYSFGAPRLAGEGDIISTPFGGGEITDVAAQEDTAYVFKERYIEAVKYTQDSDDLPVRDPLKAGIGSVGKVIKGSDDIFFVTADNKITSIGRIKLVDQLPQTDNIGYRIKRLLDTYDFSEVVGKEYNDKIYIACKSSSSATRNDIVLVYSKQLKVFEGVWNISINALEEFNNALLFGSANSPDVYKMLVGTSDVVGTTSYPIDFQATTHFMNFTPSKCCFFVRTRESCSVNR